MFRHAIRGLVRTPGFSLSTILTLALGIGANTGAFSAIDTLVLKPLPYPDPQRLVALHETALDHKPRDVAEANLLDWRARSTLFEAMAAYRPRSFGLTLGESDAVTVIQTGMAMSGFFRVTAVPPAMGRTFTEAEEASDARVIVLTDRLWRSVFAAGPQVIGRTINLNEEPYTIIGVMPRGFEYPMGAVLADAFIPLSRRDYCCGRLGSLAAAARLKRGVSIERARAELESLAAGVAAEHPDTNRGRSASLEPLAEQMTGARREPLLLLLGAASLLLLIACANVSGLMLARWMARAHEAAIRASLGAGWRQIAGPFFTEAAVLSVAGTCCGLFAAGLLLRAIPRFIPGPSPEPLHLNAAAFAFAAGLAITVAALLGALPLWFAQRTDLYSVIKAGGRAGSSPAGALRGALVVAQVALSVVLLLSAGLLLRSFLHLVNSSPGFETAHAFRCGIGIPEKRYDTERKEIEFHRELLQRLAAIPGVVAAGAAGRSPLRGESGLGGSFQGSFQIPGSNIPAAQRPRASINVASPDYFAAMGIPLIEGRAFSWNEDRPGGHRVAIVNRTFARSYLQGHALGTTLDIHFVSELNPAGSTWEIVGVAGDTRQSSMDREPVPEIFLSMTQSGADGAGYAIRTRRDDAGIPEAIAAAVALQDPRIQRVRPTPLLTLVERDLDSRDAAIQLVGGFGALALLLTAVGVYAAVAFHAAARSREIAIRMALGATASEVRGLIFGQGFRLAALGLFAGAAGFFVANPLLKSQLYGVGAADPLTLVAVAAAVLAVALAASTVPSRRAASVQPAELLRDH
ncbi:MAG: ADOP family duplicated permease [Bryobacteraceae bacterium]